MGLCGSVGLKQRSVYEQFTESFQPTVPGASRLILFLTAAGDLEGCLKVSPCFLSSIYSSLFGDDEGGGARGERRPRFPRTHNGQTGLT